MSEQLAQLEKKGSSGGVLPLPDNTFWALPYNSSFTPMPQMSTYTDGVAFQWSSNHSLTIVVGVSGKSRVTVTNVQTLSCLLGIKKDGTSNILASGSQSFSNLDISDYATLVATKAANGGTGYLTFTIS